MKKYILFTCALLFLLAQSVLLSGCATRPAEKVELIVSTAASLTDVMEELKVLYDEQNDNVILTINYGSSGALQQQIEQGAPADIFISAASAQMDKLEKQELLFPGSRLDLLRNTMVLIMPNDSFIEIQSFNDLTDAAIQKIGIGEPGSVPAGQYAKEVLVSKGLWDALEAKLVYGRDVRQVLTWVETGNVDAGIVYMTDARVSGSRIVTEAPPGSHQPVVYPAAVIAGTKHKQEASEFLTFLKSPEASDLFIKHGFKMITEK
jgi:molybdate transport system substrate-binding protein